MPPETTSERLAPRFRFAQGGVRFGKQYSVGRRRFPFSVKTAHALKIREPHVIILTGKASYDIGHGPADHSNGRRTPKGYAVWEIHPVMKMEVLEELGPSCFLLDKT